MKVNLGDKLFDIMSNKTVGLWCFRVWACLMFVAAGSVATVLYLSMAGKLGWILGTVTFLGTIVGVLSILAAFIHANRIV